VRLREVVDARRSRMIALIGDHLTAERSSYKQSKN
jgi:hypothetical protein